MKKAITIYVDNCVDEISEICATFVQRKATGTTKVHMVKADMAGKSAIYLPWSGEPELLGEEHE